MNNQTRYKVLQKPMRVEKLIRMSMNFSIVESNFMADVRPPTLRPNKSVLSPVSRLSRNGIDVMR